MSSKSEAVHKRMCDTWHWCEHRSIWHSATHIPGLENVETDTQPREMHIDNEWKLNTKLLTEAINILGVEPQVDLFASSVNAQFAK